MIGIQGGIGGWFGGLAAWRFGGATFFCFAIEISHAGGQSITDKAPLDGRQVGAFEK